MPLVKSVVTCSIVHRLTPLFAQSANIIFIERLAVLASYPVRCSSPASSYASSIVSAISKANVLVPEEAIIRNL